MAGYFSLGENKIRPGAYFNVQKRGDETNFGAIDGVVAVLFKSSIGPLGKATVLPASEGYENTFGTGGTTDALREAFYGGAVASGGKSFASFRQRGCDKCKNDCRRRAGVFSHLPRDV